MKTYILNLLALVALVGMTMSCDTDRLTFTEKDALYFNLDEDQDSLYHSLVGTLSDKDTLRIPINIMGNISGENRQYKVTVDASQTTAVEGLHYEKLQDNYDFPANKFSDYLEIVLSKTDTTLNNEDKMIALQIAESGDFTPGYTAKTSLKVYFTNKLIKPSYWDTLMHLYFGEYSKAKHNLAISIMGHDFPPTRAEATSSPYSYSYWMIQGRATCVYVIENEVYDENNNKILPWQTF